MIALIQDGASAAPAVQVRLVQKLG
jgi:hypothetical protein